MADYRLPMAYQRAFAHTTLVLCYSPLAMFNYDLPPEICDFFGHHFPDMDKAIGRLFSMDDVYCYECRWSAGSMRSLKAVKRFFKEHWHMYSDDAPGQIFADWLKGWFTGDLMLLDTKLACPDLWEADPRWEEHKRWSWSISSELGDFYQVQWDVAEMYQAATRKILLGSDDLAECAHRLWARMK